MNYLERLQRKFLHAFGILLILSAWRIGHAQVATPEQKLESLRSFIGEEAYQYVRGGHHTDKLASCEIRPSALNPDSEGSFDVMPRLSAWSDVMMHELNLTNRESNGGVIAYMRASVQSDAQFFQSAFHFYQWLKGQDDQWQTRHQTDLSNAAPSPMGVQADSKKIFSKALSLSRWNQYQALRLMALYGHDNLNNQLSHRFRGNDCRWVIMDLLKPEQSQLYHSAAIPELPYNREWIERGRDLATSCADRAHNVAPASLARELHQLCSEQRPDYQADYYHVITSSFLNCRGEIAWEREGQLPSTVIPFLELADDTTRHSQEYFVRHYKYSRFMEEIDRADIPFRSKRLLKSGLEAIWAHQSPFKTLTWHTLKHTMPLATLEMLKAILERYQFEMKFRVYQHKLGAEFALKTCRGSSSYGQAGEGLAHHPLKSCSR